MTAFVLALIPREVDTGIFPLLSVSYPPEYEDALELGDTHGPSHRSRLSRSSTGSGRRPRFPRLFSRSPSGAQDLLRPSRHSTSGVPPRVSSSSETDMPSARLSVDSTCSDVFTNGHTALPSPSVICEEPGEEENVPALQAWPISHSDSDAWTGGDHRVGPATASPTTPDHHPVNNEDQESPDATSLDNLHGPPQGTL